MAGEGTDDKENFGIVVDGITMPGYDTLEQAQTAIDNDSNLQKKGAVATKLYGNPKKGIYKSGDKPWS